MNDSNTSSSATLTADASPIVKSSIQVVGLPIELPLEAASDNVPASIPEVDSYVLRAFDSSLSELVRSRTLGDFIEAFAVIRERFGKVEFVLAVTFYTLWKEKIYRRIGFDSLEELIGALPPDLRKTRQSLYDSIRGGQVLVEQFGFLEYGLTNNPRVDLSFLYRNFAKLPVLWLAIYRKRRPLSAELFEHFQQDTLVAFREYVRGKKAKPVTARGPSKGKSQVVRDLDAKKRRIVEAIGRGQAVAFIIDKDEDFCVEAARRFEIHRAGNDAYERNTALDYSAIDGRDLAAMRPGQFKESILDLEETLERLSIEAIIKIMSEQFRTVVDLRIAQAYVIHRLKHDPELRAQLPQYGVECPEDFALRYLGVDAPTYKWLGRIGRNLVMYAPLFGRELDFSFQGALDKLSILHHAIETHAGKADYVIDMLRTTTVAKFRRFARDAAYDPRQEPEPITKRLLVQSTELLLEYDRLIAQGHRVEILPLRHKAEVAFFERFLRGFEARWAAKRNEPVILPTNRTPIQLPDACRALPSPTVSNAA
jgi:hypothetical protein